MFPNDWITLYEGPPQQPLFKGKSNIFSPPLMTNGIEPKILLITMNTLQSESWSEIDAIQLIGIPTEAEFLNGMKELWAGAVLAVSSEYGNGWVATNVIGKPSVYPKYGDDSKAWAPKSESGTFEFITLDFLEPLLLSKIEIYETYCPGALVKVTGYSNHSSMESGTVLYQGAIEEGLPDLARIKTIEVLGGGGVAIAKSIPIRYLRLDIDTTRSKGYYEIDAVKVTVFPVVGLGMSRTL